MCGVILKEIFLFKKVSCNTKINSHIQTKALVQLLFLLCQSFFGIQVCGNKKSRFWLYAKKNIGNRKNRKESFPMLFFYWFILGSCYSFENLIEWFYEMANY